MRTLFLLSAFLHLNVALAQLEFEPAKQILMKAKTCEELQTHAASIVQWTKMTSNTLYEIPECFCSSHSCQMDVGRISPYIVKALSTYDSGFAMSSAYDGPNCFNAALVATNTLPKLSYTHPYEMTAFLQSSLCEEKAVGEPLVPGDILVVRDQRQEYLEIHAGIYISDTLAFSKYGESSLMPYAYGLNVAKSYGVQDQACKRVQGVPKAGDPCFEKPFVNYFRCVPFYTFVSKIVNQPSGLNKEAQAIYAKTSSLDITISDIAFSGKKIDAVGLKSLQEDLLRLNQTAVDFTNKIRLDKNNRELLQLMRFRLFSMFEQTRIIAHSLKFQELAAPAMDAPK